jgi:hypothetical protein
LTVEEPAPVFEGVEATFERADEAREDVVPEDVGFVEEGIDDAVDSAVSVGDAAASVADTTAELADTAVEEFDSAVEEVEEELEIAAEEAVSGAEEPTFGALDEVGVSLETPPEAPPPLFGKRDPKEKAQRLARVLVSDIILYNPDRHHIATESGRVKEEFEEEIQKSWNEYVEQVGEEIANTTSFFNDALNEILAKGEEIF